MIHLVPTSPESKSVKFVLVGGDSYPANIVCEIYVGNDGSGFVKFFVLINGHNEMKTVYGEVEVVYEWSPVASSGEYVDAPVNRKVRVR